MDKAYMRINYPANDPNDETQKQLQAALVTVGMVKSEPDTARQIREVALKADPNGVVDPSQIRELFSAWCRRVIPVAIISEGGDASGGTSSATLPLKAPSPTLTNPPTITMTKGPMCAVKDRLSKTTQSGLNPAKASNPNRMKAVNNTLILDVRWPLDDMEVKPENKNFRAKATYSFAPCPLYKDQPEKLIQPSQYRKQMVADALYDWGLYASINWSAVEHPKDGDPKFNDLSHLVIVFQDHHYNTDKPILANESG